MLKFYNNFFFYYFLHLYNIITRIAKIVLIKKMQCPYIDLMRFVMRREVYFIKFPSKATKVLFRSHWAFIVRHHFRPSGLCTRKYMRNLTKSLCPSMISSKTTDREGNNTVHTSTDGTSCASRQTKL